MERTVQAEMFFHTEFERTGVVSPIDWWLYQRLISDTTVLDPTGAHWPYGLLVPQLVKGQLNMPVCFDQFVEKVMFLDNEEFEQWMQYWIQHMRLHLIVRASLWDLWEKPPTAQVEEESVQQIFRENAADLCEWADRIKVGK